MHIAEYADPIAVGIKWSEEYSRSILVFIE